ncbi:hypothetical protein ACODT3_27620 [Streptomyces sp. 4.24]|uniref:DUF4190 domain-containing protein n=1 Tax=Streptomyces tritrimontium TaxID=3406573 RepID=UPI003BB5DBAF
MSTPPNPPSTPSGPPTEPAGTPIPEAASIPAPSQPLSLEKPPADAAPAQTPAEPAAQIPAQVPAEPAADTPAQVPAEPAAQAPAQAPAEPAAAATPAPPAPGSFAPVSPAAPTPAFGAPYGHAAPGGPVPGNPWASPQSGGGYPAPHGFPPPPSATNGLAVAALILGLLGIFVGLIPFFFWAGALLAVTGPGLGIGAIVKSRKGAPRGTLAAFGTALSVLAIAASVGGWFITANFVDKIQDKVAEENRYGDYEFDEDDMVLPSSPPLPTPKTSPSPSQVPGLTSALPFGETFTYPSGVEVKVSVPKKYVTDNEYIKVGNAVQVTLTITNNSTENVNVIYAVPNLRDEQGLAGKLVFDGEMPKMVRGDILPGATATGIMAWEVPKGTANLTADITPGGRLPSVKYSGPIG